MTGPDPVDVRLLSAVAEMGRAAIPDLATRLGMDVRDVAARLAALSTTGLPLIVGVECDPQGIRNAVAAAQQWAAQHGAASGPHGMPPHSGPQQVPPQPPMTSGGPSTPQHSGPQPMPPAQPMNSWGPPASAGWVRAEQPLAPVPQTGRIGSKLQVSGPDGERLTIGLVEVVDPADFLFTAAGHELRPGERAVVVHTELTNRGQQPLAAPPDQNLELVAEDGSTIGKAPVSLSSRPPHRAGVQPGQTAGGHTIYVLPEATELTAVRWALHPGNPQFTLTWDITEL
ncbi:AsnC family protein [Saccharopolyspora griseoalba]|uniref:AsnC family protein n=1 Tax=Saccharopolyspora griseoalba TaxID=1431848 RepID=A0ABW2LG62_9PSEU